MFCICIFSFFSLSLFYTRSPSMSFLLCVLLQSEEFLLLLCVKHSPSAERALTLYGNPIVYEYPFLFFSLSLLQLLSLLPFFLCYEMYSQQFVLHFKQSGGVDSEVTYPIYRIYLITLVFLRKDNRVPLFMVVSDAPNTTRFLLSPSTSMVWT